MRDFLFTHPVMKMISLGLAFFLWFLVRSEQRVTKNVDVDVEVINKPDDLIISGDWDRQISLRLIGPQSRLTRLNDDYFPPYQLDLKSARPGSNPFWVHEEDFKVPHEVQITRVVPQSIRIKLDEVEERLIPIEPQFVDQFEEGFEMTEFEVVPSHLKITGSRKEVARLTGVNTEPISRAGRRKDFEIEVKVAPQGGNLSGDERKALVKIYVRENEITKILKEIPIKLVGLKGTASTRPKTVSLKVKGPAGKVADLAEEKLEVEVDMTNLPAILQKRRKFRVRPTPVKRPGLAITVIPEKILVTRLSN